ncbi:hypothetical protein L228DRAFT_270100 [Xylona heveae TC161]|uniref:Uncharacterized protein n=1 Tax=Xylona heveae (strain CBS 132557 / TC161) TaxID=1328760 RepID=A0A165FCI4_XYLHT|nr:hypothetical protein L228DRAFT_270100 [Xylona heveae TC161]KZF20823.1 hypothetical protein L228DRAFT_270100 [Xylona heveae TC161]
MEDPISSLSATQLHYNMDEMGGSLDRQRRTKASRPLSEISFSSIDKSLGKPTHAMGYPGERPRSPTFELAYFLRHTGPPASTQTHSQPHSHPTHSKSAFRFLKPHRSVSKKSHAHAKDISSSQRLPDSVIMKKSAQGKRYLAIKAPGFDEYNLGDDSSSLNSSPMTNRTGDADVRFFEKHSTGPNTVASTVAGRSRGTSRSSQASHPFKPPPLPLSWKDASENLGREALDIYLPYINHALENSKLARYASSSNSTASANGQPLQQVEEEPKQPTPKKATRGVTSPLSGASSIHHSGSIYAAWDPSTPGIASPIATGPPSRVSSIQRKNLHPSDSAITLSCTTSPHSGTEKRRSTDRASMQSAIGSVAETVYSDASSGVVMNALRADMHRPAGVVGQYTNIGYKPPRPGPAPTRALPSLPENHHGRIRYINTARKAASQGARSLQSLRSSSASLEDATARLNIRESMTSNRPGGVIRHDPLRSESQPQLPTYRSTSDGALASGKHTRIDTSGRERASESAQRARKGREDSVRARKLRDLEAARASLERRGVEVNFDPTMAKMLCDRSEPITAFFPLPKSAFSDSRTSRSSGFSGVSQGSSSLSSMGRQLKDAQRHLNTFSPIMQVIDQVPTTQYDTSNRLEAVSQKSVDAVGPIEPEQSINPTIITTISQSPEANSNPTSPTHIQSAAGSADHDQANHPAQTHLEPVLLTSLATTSSSSSPSSNRTVKGPGSDKARSTGSGRSSLTSSTDLELKMEARLNAMERKNAILEAALLAVLQTSSNLGGTGPASSSTGTRSSADLPARRNFTP